MDGGLALVWAASRDGVLGLDGGLPWHLPEDLAAFRELTWGATVVMGRRTWQSLPAAVRPLPGRRTVVLSRDAAFEAPGAQVAADLPTALALAHAGGGAVWVAGGEQVYRQTLPLADRVVATEVDLVVGAPPGRVARCPRLDQGWRVVRRTPEHGWATSRTGLRHRVLDHRRDGG